VVNAHKSCSVLARRVAHFILGRGRSRGLPQALTRTGRHSPQRLIESYKRAVDKTVVYAFAHLDSTSHAFNRVCLLK
jgi:hypothetical protein